MTASAQPIHVAITRRINPGREQEFQSALKEFFARSLAESGVHGAAMLVPPPGSGSAEYGIIRSFANVAERDAFYASPLYLDWKKRVAPLSNGEPDARELHGLEAFFRQDSPSRTASLRLANSTASKRFFARTARHFPLHGKWPSPLTSVLYRSS